MALNDSCHLLNIETKHHFIQKSGGALSPIDSAATGVAIPDGVTVGKV